MSESKVNRTHIEQQILTSIGSNHLETQIYDGFYVEGSHALRFGAILHDKEKEYRLYYSFDGVGIDIMMHHMHIVLTTTNFGSPYNQYTWLFIGQDIVRHIFSKETILEDNRIRISDQMLRENNKSIATFRRHILRIIAGDGSHQTQ